MIWKRPVLFWFTALAIAFSSCQDADDEVREPADPPSPDFSSSNTNCRAPCEVDFTSLVNNAESFLWTFGDGDTSSKPNPAHIYERRGTYSVSLKVSNESGTEVIVKEVTIDSGYNTAAIQSITINDYPATDTNNMSWDPNSPADIFVELLEEPDNLIITNTPVFPNAVDTINLPNTWNFSAPLPSITDFDATYSFRLIDEDSGTPNDTILTTPVPKENLRTAPNPYPSSIPIENTEGDGIGSMAVEWRQQ